MRTNEELAHFLREQRKRIGKTQAEIAEELGMSSPCAYNRMENRGLLPRDATRQSRLAEILGTSRDDLLSKADLRETEEQNLLPIIKALATINCEAVYMADIEYLVEIQSDLEQPVSVVLVQELMKLRKTESVVLPPHENGKGN